jgi:hypothetical protein
VTDENESFSDEMVDLLKRAGEQSTSFEGVEKLNPHTRI